MSPNLFGGDIDLQLQQGQLGNFTWEGSEVQETTGTLGELYQTVPLFSRHPYRQGGEENRYKDEIRREPLRIDENQRPIATVGKAYCLIQHREVLASVHRALKLVDLDCTNRQSSLLMSEYGERMRWSCQLPNFDFDPGDNNMLVLRINCLNSVDMSTSLEVALSWFRLVCDNGLMYGVKESRLRKRHIRSLDPADIAAYLSEQLEDVKSEMSLYRQWFKCKLELETAAEWADTTVKGMWGTHLAARVWHIISEGVDGEVQPSNDKRPPHELRLKSSRPVPGAPVPTRNLYYASQALSWVAGTRHTFQEQIGCMSMIPALMNPLADKGNDLH
jgi:Domain of unknown function (DUF932)